jgi:hypothetical protein
MDSGLCVNSVRNLVRLHGNFGKRGYKPVQRTGGTSEPPSSLGLRKYGRVSLANWQIAGGFVFESEDSFQEHQNFESHCHPNRSTGKLISARAAHGGGSRRGESIPRNVHVNCL